MLALSKRCGRTHGERLPARSRTPFTRAVCAGELDLLVGSSGPGAFTGLRIGLAATRVAHGVGKLVVGVPRSTRWPTRRAWNQAPPESRLHLRMRTRGSVAAAYRAHATSRIM